ncbi:MAG: DUF2891 domain-containing protein [Marinifilaceae bacterium]|jgi:hypothetical protein|nr:DUF2891 domain-containing protein [Marinifilaceae bacterium]
MTKLFYISALLILFTACNNHKNITSKLPSPSLNQEQAAKIALLPLHGIYTEYPNKLSQVLSSASELKSPKELHPAFYGCFDWHSAVHGHWSLVKILKLYPNIEMREKIEKALTDHISKENITKELEYFKKPHEKSFERTYGWAWLLKLSEEIKTWDGELARKLEQNLAPLTEYIAKNFIEFLPKLNYPIRVGTHTNTAFAMSFAYDYSICFNDNELKNMIVQRAEYYYLNDKHSMLRWEPNGTDFLSPTLQEINLMRKILPKPQFKKWLINSEPSLIDEEFTLSPAIVSDRNDGHLVHLDGLNFSRAWCLYGIAQSIPECNHLYDIADKHLRYSINNIFGDSYEGSHWLGTFALYALTSKK